MIKVSSSFIFPIAKVVPIILFFLSISTRGIKIHFWVISEALKHVSDSLRITKGFRPATV